MMDVLFRISNKTFPSTSDILQVLEFTYHCVAGYLADIVATWILHQDVIYVEFAFGSAVFLLKTIYYKSFGISTYKGISQMQPRTAFCLIISIFSCFCVISNFMCIFGFYVL